MGQRPTGRIAAISGVMPKIFMTRGESVASTCSAISILTRFNALIRRWVAPIPALIVPERGPSSRSLTLASELPTRRTEAVIANMADAARL